MWLAENQVETSTLRVSAIGCGLNLSLTGCYRPILLKK